MTAEDNWGVWGGFNPPPGKGEGGGDYWVVDYEWEVGRGAMSQWWAGWVEERADGRCDSPPDLLSCLQKMELRRVERGWEWERNSS